MRSKNAVIVDAVRTPIGRRGGGLSHNKPAVLLRTVLLALLERNALRDDEVGQIIGGCVAQVGEQGMNVTRNAWLSTGLDYRVGCTTVDVSCGSATQANHLIASLIESGMIDVGIACGVEVMSRVPAGANIPGGRSDYQTDDYPWNDPPGLQFGGAERIAQRQGYTREDLDNYGLLSQQRAAHAWDSGRFDREIVTPPPSPDQSSPLLQRDEGLRTTSPEALAALAPIRRDGLHTAGTTSQVSDGAAAILWMSHEAAQRHGLAPRAQLVRGVVTGGDPYYLLDGPTEATRRLLKQTGMSLADIATLEVNEAFASVVLSFLDHTGADPDRVNVNGGAIALGHPMGATGARLLSAMLHELERTDREFGLAAMCCGGSLGTATLLQRL